MKREIYCASTQDYILCFNVKDIDLVAYSDFKFDAKMIKEKGLIEFGENKVEADAIVPVDITKHTMSYPHYEMYKCHKADCVHIDAEEGRNYKFSLWNYLIGMGVFVMELFNRNGRNMFSS